MLVLLSVSNNKERQEHPECHFYPLLSHTPYGGLLPTGHSDTEWVSEREIYSSTGLLIIFVFNNKQLKTAKSDQRSLLK